MCRPLWLWWCDSVFVCVCVRVHVYIYYDVNKLPEITHTHTQILQYALVEPYRMLAERERERERGGGGEGKQGRELEEVYKRLE